MEKQQTLSLTAPFSGLVTDRVEALHVGQWINKELPLAYVVDPPGEELHALAPEATLCIYKRAIGPVDSRSADRPSLEAH